MTCLYLKERDCHLEKLKTTVLSDCYSCENYLADTIIRKWTAGGARSFAMEDDIIKIIKERK